MKTSIGEMVRSKNGRQQTMSAYGETMKDAPSTPKEKEHANKRVKASIYKLQLNIEVAMNLKKVLKEHILNGKVELNENLTF